MLFNIDKVKESFNLFNNSLYNLNEKFVNVELIIYYDPNII
jgi:hypothetical protein